MNFIHFPPILIGNKRTCKLTHAAKICNCSDYFAGLYTDPSSRRLVLQLARKWVEVAGR